MSGTSLPCEEGPACSNGVSTPLGEMTIRLMPVFKIARFEVRPDAQAEVERAMREFALYVGLELEDSSWTTYRDRAHPNRYVSLITADDPDAAEHQRTAGGAVHFARRLSLRLIGQIDTREYELVATSRGGLPP